MSEMAGPTVGRRRLALELRRRRAGTGMTIHDVAERLECSSGKVSRIETGVVGVRVQDARDMLELYGVPAKEREQLLDLVRASRKRAWWHAYTDVVPPESATFYGFEDGAAVIEQHAVALVPGLLQSEDYARAVIDAAADADPSVRERRRELRLRRQQLLDRTDPPQLRVVLDEAVLHRRVGGTEVMAGQLDRLVELTVLPHVRIQVIPFGAGSYTALSVPFTIFGFADSADPRIVYLEQLTRNTHLDDPREIAHYVSAFAEATAKALTAEDSTELLTDRATAWRSGVAG